MWKRILLLLALLFALAGVAFVLPRFINEETAPPESPAEVFTESMPESSFPHETVEIETEPTETEYQPGNPVIREKTPAKLIIASDIHYMSHSLTDYGQAFTELVDNGDGKVVRYMPQIWQAFADEVVAAAPDALVLCGDLTLNGEKVNHEELASLLAQIEEAGVQVLVIPGNHDINNPYATSYFGEKQSFVEQTTPEDFLRIYSPYGYSEAVSWAPDSLSYLYELNDTTWMMMLDTCIYDPENEVGGVVNDDTVEWMEKCLISAYEQGITVIPVGHHNLQELSRVYLEECVIQNHEEVMELLEKYLTPAYFSGHLHVQRIRKHIKEPGVASSVYGICEVVSNSLIIPPCQYGELSLAADGTMSYHTKNVDVSAWAAANGETSPDLLDFPTFSNTYLRNVISRQTYKAIEDIPDEIRGKLADFYADVYQAYYAGQKIDYEEKKKEEGYRLWERFMDPSIQFRQLEGMMKDSMVENNNVEIPNPVWQERS